MLNWDIYIVENKYNNHIPSIRILFVVHPVLLFSPHHLITNTPVGAAKVAMMKLVLIFFCRGGLSPVIDGAFHNELLSGLGYNRSCFWTNKEVFQFWNVQDGIMMTSYTLSQKLKENLISQFMKVHDL